MKKLLFYLLMTLSMVRGQFLKPLADYRNYRFYHLSNGMKVLSVHHPRTRQAGFSVGVATGSLHDPIELPGLAHYLEHMLFLGTEKYSDPASFDKFISEHGGLNNAFTDDEMTVFYNQIEDSALEEGLDRFSEFFKNPLFNSDLASREVHSVDAEHRKNVPLDDDRVWFTIRSTAKGPLSHFSTGNVETLQKTPKKRNINVIDELRKFYKMYYCGQNMVAVTLSPRSIDEQVKLVHAKFGSISAKNGKWLEMFGPCPGNTVSKVKPFDSSNTGQFIHIQGNGTPSLWITFALRPLYKEYTKQPLSYLSYLMEYKGNGGLLARLRKLGLAEEVVAAADKNSVSTLFGVKVLLTDNGAKKSHKVIKETFTYINMLRKNGANSKILSSIQRQSKIDFHMKEPIGDIMEDVAKMSVNLLKYDPNHVLSGQELIIETDEKLIEQLLQNMTPANAIIAFSDTNFPKNYNDLHMDPYYRVLHKVFSIPNDTKAVLEAVLPRNEELKYPPPLLYVPTSKQLSIMPLPSNKLPMLVKKTNGYEIWWQGHGEFQLPKISIRLIARVPANKIHLQSTAEALLYANTIADALEEKTFDMQNCGMNQSFRYQNGAYHISFNGVSDDQISNLMSIVAEKIKNYEVEESRFKRIKQSFIDLLKDTENELAYQHAMDVAGVISTNNIYGRDDFLQQAKSTKSFATLKRTVDDFKNVYVNCFVKGNIEADKSVELVEEFINKAGFRPLTKNLASKSLIVTLKAPVEASLKNPIPKDENHVTLVQYQYGVPSIPARVNLGMIGQMLNRRLYDHLRTSKQLGYIVAANSKMDSSVESLSCLVEGSAENPNEVEKSIDAELLAFRNYLEDMPIEEFKEWKAAIHSDVSAPVVNFDDELNRNWEPIHNSGYCFNKRELELEYIEKMLQSPSQLLETYSDLIQQRHRLVVKMFAHDSKVPYSASSIFNVSMKQHAVVLSKLLKNSTHTTYSLVDISNKVVSHFQSYMGYWPYETICELPKQYNNVIA